MSANQKPDYRPTAITQRDGSRLQNSNCRMASIATGLDFDTLGAKKSTGARMRSKQSDQEGGTDSGDAKRAWADGYGENLDVQDGKVWADVLTDLRRFRIVHLDVWHATVGGPCLSGTGRYGHTIVVAPDCVDNNWLVCDPWCSPAKWSRVSEAKLKAGAEEWGRRVYGAATSGPGASNEPSGEVLRHIVKRLMSRYHPGDDGEEDPTEDPGDTGGAQRVMYTATTPHAPAPTPVPPTTGGPDVGIVFDPRRFVDKGTPLYLDPDFKDQVTTSGVGGYIYSIGWAAKRDENGWDSSKVALRSSTTKLATDGRKLLTVLWAKRDDLGEEAPASQPWEDSIWALTGDINGRFPCPPGEDCPDCPPPPDVSVIVAEAVTARDGEWQEWVLDGSPGQREQSTMAVEE